MRSNKVDDQHRHVRELKVTNRIQLVEMLPQEYEGVQIHGSDSGRLGTISRIRTLSSELSKKTITYSYHCLSEFLRVTELGCIHRVPLNCLLGRSVKLCDLDTGTARW